MSNHRETLSSHPDCIDAVRRLRAVARQIEVFFETQMRKLNEAASKLNELSSENDIALRLASDLEQQKQSWEQDKDQESQRLIEAGEKLALAWQELEDRQREVTQPRYNPEQKRSRKLEPSKPKAPVIAENNETTLFEMRLLQQQVAEHARRHNR